MATNSQKNQILPPKPFSYSLSNLTVGFFVLALIILFAGAGIAVDYFRFWGLLLAVGLAAGVCGAITGFLFGIPRVNKAFNPYDGFKQKQKYDPNTNLEDISDWLTKIIVGVSLTQINTIPGKFMSIAEYILKHNNGTFHTDFARPVIISVILFFLIGGFIIAYNYTRVQLPRILSLYDDNAQLTSDASAALASLKKVLDTSQSNDLNNESTLGKNILIASLTPDEIALLKTILRYDNRFTIPDKPLTNAEFSALRVLIAKNIVTIIQGGEIRQGAVVSIVNNEIRETISRMPD